METILLPTDFSPTAIDPLTPGIQMLDIESSKENSAKGLDNFMIQIKAFANNIEIDTINEYGALADGLDEVCAKTNAGLVVMGISGGGMLEEKLIGSNALSVAKHTKTPVVIVPAKTSFTRVSSVMLASDFDKNDKTIPVKSLRNILEETKAKFYVFHVEESGDKEAVAYSGNLTAENYALHSLLHGLQPEYYVAKNNNFVEAVNEFVLAKEIDLIIAVSRKHGFFASLFKESHTKMLAFHSTVPVMVING